MKNKGIELWGKAKTIIPGGNQLLSKRSERFLPGLMERELFMKNILISKMLMGNSEQ